MAGLVQLATSSISAICAACLDAYRRDPTSGIELASELHGFCPHPDCCRNSSLASQMMLRKSEIPLGQSQGFDEEVGMILKQIYPPTMMMDLEASSQEAIMELAKAFPYHPAAGAAGLNKFQRVCHACHAQTAFIAQQAWMMMHSILMVLIGSRVPAVVLKSCKSRLSDGGAPLNPNSC